MKKWFFNKDARTQRAHPCACCGCRTVSFLGDICPVCFWEEDLVEGPDSPSSANHGLTLTQAQKNYRDFGACEKEMLRHVRAPKPEERSGIDD